MLTNPANLLVVAGVVILMVAIVVIVLNTRDYSDDIDELHREICRLDTEIDEHIKRIDTRIDTLEGDTERGLDVLANRITYHS